MCLVASKKHPPKVAEEYNGMMEERFTTFTFSQPLPKAERVMDWSTCGRCAAQFYLTHGTSVPGHADRLPSQSKLPIQQPESSTGAGLPVAQGTPQPSLPEALTSLHGLHLSGALSSDEFTAAKRRLLTWPQ